MRLSQLAAQHKCAAARLGMSAAERSVKTMPERWGSTRSLCGGVSCILLRRRRASNSLREIRTQMLK